MMYANLKKEEKEEKILMKIQKKGEKKGKNDFLK